VPLAVVSVLGSIVGVGLILVSSQRAFEGIVPFLVLCSLSLVSSLRTLIPVVAKKRRGAAISGRVK
jgi:uncharacterized membrane protein YfcA